MPPNSNDNEAIVFATVFSNVLRDLRGPRPHVIDSIDMVQRQIDGTQENHRLIAARDATAAAAAWRQTRKDTTR